MENNLKILFISAEVAPFAKTGGLADVAGSLPQALAALGHDVRIVMPKYKIVKGKYDYVTDFPIHMDNRTESCIVRGTEVNFNLYGTSGKVPVYFTDNYHYFDRDGIYCHHDDAERFSFFCRAALEMLPNIDFKPDIIHCNDWHTGPICMMLKETYSKNEFYKDIATVFTVHNLEYQGHFPHDTIKFLNVGDDVFVPEKVEFYGSLNFMKAGLVYADVITTVSEQYADEIKTEQYGEKLDGLLRKRSEDLIGIVNGISYEAFDPASDKNIYKNYSSKTYYDKKYNKYALQEELGLPHADVPVLGLVSRLSGQKGLDLVINAAAELMKENLQLILLGTGDDYYEDSFKKLMKDYPSKFYAFLGFNAELAQKIYAGSDIFLMPSRFEPCGLGQIISLRYGTIPVVRATGGLADTIKDFDEDNKNGNGFSFVDFSSDEFLKTVYRALHVYNNKPEVWNGLVRKALSLDYSWKNPAEKYVNVYRLAINKIV